MSEAKVQVLQQTVAEGNRSLEEAIVACAVLKEKLAEAERAAAEPRDGDSPKFTGLDPGGFSRALLDKEIISLQVENSTLRDELQKARAAAAVVSSSAGSPTPGTNPEPSQADATSATATSAAAARRARERERVSGEGTGRGYLPVATIPGWKHVGGVTP